MSGLNWVFVTVGVIGVFFADGFGLAEAAAIVLALGYVITIQSVPLAWLRRPLTKEALVVISTASIASSAALSGGFRSPFVLLTITPIVVAALVGGYRLGVTTGLLSVSLTALSEISSGSPDWPRIAVWAGFGIIVAVTFSLARKLILELVQQADVIASLSADTGARLERLQSANNLIGRFESLTVAAELDPESVSTALLSSVRSLVPFGAARVEIADGSVVAKAGTNGEAESTTVLPIEHDGHRMGTLHLKTPRPLTERQLDIVGDLVAPVGLAFANIGSVKRIARAAIEEERARVARELHDGIGPGLASLGLALDVAHMQSGDLPALAGELSSMRDVVTSLVHDVRSTVEDLRTAETQSLAEALSDLRWGAVEFQYRVVEKAPLRTSHVADVNAIVIEAARNALRHASPATVTISGFLDRDRGEVEISDDGNGFDPGKEYPGHFGIVGMSERAARLDGEIRLESDGDGTRLLLVWPMTP